MHRARRAFCDLLTMAVSYSPRLLFSRISRVSSGPPSSWVHIGWLLFVEMRNVQYSTLLCTRTSIFCRRQHVEFVLNSTGRQNSVQTKSIDFTITTLVDRRDCCILDSSYYIERKYVKKMWEKWLVRPVQRPFWRHFVLWWCFWRGCVARQPCVFGIWSFNIM
jgi:hypothetical protein